MVNILAVGDLILDEPDPGSFFDPSRALLHTGDLVIGHVEVPHSTTRTQTSTDVPAPPADPAALGALADAGFGAVTLAGNHICDAGPQGLRDTVDHARSAGLRTSGAGATLAEARTPAICAAGGRLVAILSYNCVGPRESWATSAKPGCAYIHILTHYELEGANPGGPPRVYTFAEPDHLNWLATDIAAARENADIVLVSFHKGIVHTPGALAMYEGPLARAAIDAGADAVIGQHAHILRGIEMHRGRPIFHGLGNFVTVTRALTPADGDHPEREAWARKRKELFGFTPDPGMPFYPFHPESRNAMIASMRFAEDGAITAGFIPCWIDERGRPTPRRRHDGGQQIADYVESITRRLHPATRFSWRDDDFVEVEDSAAA
ncbi:CapA family protein [Actinoallomurus spadix]|nr:CapA family protein [Actinoallomurus spadix]MCO5990451.1 CapA family protein [Actinoallomurus spadix]